MEDNKKINTKVKSKNIQVPHTYVILFMLILLVSLATYLVPAGKYDIIKDASTGRDIVNVESFKYVARTPVNLFKMLMSIPLGMQKAANIVFFVFIMGGCFNMIQATGAIESGISRTIVKLKGRDRIVIPIVMFMFSVLGFTIGASEECMAFIPITIMLARGFGYDDVVGVAMVSTGACIGFAGGMLNPFTVGIAQGIAQLPMYSGFAFRTVGYVIIYIIAVLHVMRYADKVKANPKNSVIYDLTQNEDKNDQDYKLPEITVRHRIILITLIAGLGFMVYGVIKKGWYINELCALFILLAIVTSIIGKLSMNKMAESFVKGAKDIAFGALVVGLARTVLVVMEQGQIMDSIIYNLVSVIGSLPVQVTSIGMFIINSIINFFIPSGSGQAATVMPIMTPLADVVGITRQTAVLAFQYGDAFSNQIIPTSGSLLGMLAISKVPYDRWVKYNWKLVVYWSIAGAVLLFIASTIKLGPF